jgi:serine/threonine protein kinase
MADWTSVEGYELIRELGRGAMGSVYLARQAVLDREVAVKRLIGAATDLDIRAEARLLARLNHQHVVRVYELVTAGEDVLMVMEYVPGVDLRRLLAERRLSPATVLEYVEQLAAALDHAHGQGVVHHDVKPGNVMVKPEGVLKLGDFGVAELRARRPHQPAGAPPPLVGTPEYMAPEIVQRDPAADHRADVYSLAVVAYELLAGRLPFPADPRDPRRTLRAQVEQAPPRPGLPGQLDAALLRGLEKRAERRPRSAGELAAALRSAAEPVQGGETIAPFDDPPPPPRERSRSGDDGALAGTIGPSGAIGQASAPSMATPAPPPPRPVPARPARSASTRGPARWRAPLVAGVVVLALALAAAAFARSRQAAPAAATPLEVSSVSATVVPASGAGHCPETDFTFHGAIATNGGAGTITYRWLQPDGQASAPQSIAVQAGTRLATATLVFKFSGNGSDRGQAALHVTSPIDAYSAPVAVTYTCP